MAGSYIISIYLGEKNYKVLLLLPLFILIGLASGKIAIIIYLIFIFILLLSVFSYKNSGYIVNVKILIKYLSISTLFLIILGGLFVSLNPRLNPEGRVGGSINIEHIQKYMDKYNNADTMAYAKSLGIKGQGRSDAHGAVYDLLSKSGVLAVLFGYGPGDIVMSSYKGYADPFLQKYHIGYGGRIGYLWLSAQIGYVGAMLWALFHISLLIKMAKFKRIRKEDSDYKYILTFYGFSAIFFLDYLTYSSTFLLDPAAILVYYFLYVYIRNISIQHNKVSNDR
jgi:hypothetical protein